MAERPNILFFHVDNLGFGEPSCYSGGPFRGTVTERIDGFAGEGFRLTQLLPRVAVHADALGVDDGTAFGSFGASLRHEPLISAGAPLDHVPLANTT